MTTTTEAMRQARDALPEINPFDHPEHHAMVWTKREIAWIKDYAARAALAAIDALPGAPAWPCYCDERGIGKPGVTCGDCPRDYGHTPASAPSGEPAGYVDSNALGWLAAPVRGPAASVTARISKAPIGDETAATASVAIIDSPETGYPSRVIDGQHVPCTHDGRVHPDLLSATESVAGLTDLTQSASACVRLLRRSPAMSDPIDIAEGYSAEPYGDGYIICHSGGGRAVAQLDIAAAVREITRLRALAAQVQQPGITAREVARQVFEVCEDYEAAPNMPNDSQEVERFKAGTRFAAKRIRNAIGDWLTSAEAARPVPAPSDCLWARNGNAPCRSSTAAAAPEPVAPEYLFVQMDDDKRAWHRWCADAAEVREAVKAAMFIFPAGKDLSAEHAEQLDASTEELMDSGALTFEGDPPLYLFRMTLAARGKTPAAHPAPAVAATVRGLTEAQIEDCIDEANHQFNGRRMGPCGQQMTTYDDWKHWLARAIERACAAAWGVTLATPAAPKEQQQGDSRHD